MYMDEYYYTNKWKYENKYIKWVERIMYGYDINDIIKFYFKGSATFNIKCVSALIFHIYFRKIALQK